MKEYIESHILEVVLTGTGILFTLSLIVIFSVVWYIRTRKKAAKATFFVAGTLLLTIMLISTILGIYLQNEEESQEEVKIGAVSSKDAAR